MYNSDRRNASRQSSQYRRQSSSRENDYVKEEYVLPRNGLRTSLTIGVLGGLLALLIPIGITLASASWFSQASHPDQSTPLQVAIITFVWSLCGNVVLVDLFIAFVVGMVTGQVVVKRWLGALAGTIPGACIALYYIITSLFPNYPGHISSGTTTNPLGVLGGYGLDIFLAALWGVVGGAISFVGAWITTLRHPYHYLR